MCETCGCYGTGPRHEAGPLDKDEHARLHAAGIWHAHAHEHGHGHEHEHGPGHAQDGTAAPGAGRGQPDARTVRVEQDVLAHNQRLAERNRGWLAGRGVVALNLVSSPGSGKTSILEATLRALHGEFAISVIEGDQATQNDAQRIRATGSRAVQINTGAGCHLDAAMVARGLEELDPPAGSLVMIENVGNLVCPALFDLGELAKVVVLSVTEGEDKPIKYPHMFRASRLMLLNKTDLLPYVDFDVERCIGYARQVNPDIEALCVSARSGEGMPAWLGWLRARSGQGRGPEVLLRKEAGGTVRA